MTALELNGISKSFKNDEVLSGLSLSADEGETVVIFGPSGTGKTVLLRLISGIYDPDDGDIRLSGSSVIGIAPERRGVGMAFQNFALYPHMEAAENIASPLQARGGTSAQIADKVRDIASLLKIDHVLSHRPKELSNGQKQRTALARALVAGPKILLLDDPLRNVDAKLRFEMRLELPRLLREFQSTTLYVTQDYKEAMALGDRIAVLLDGGFAQVATPEDIYRDPVNIEVAKLFGDPTINLIPSRIVTANGGTHADLAGSPIDLGPGYAHAAGREIYAGIRPEAISISQTATKGALPVELIAVTPLNERVVMLLHLADGTEFFASAPEEGAAGSREHGPAFAGIYPADLLIFARDSGQRIQPQTSNRQTL
ncbi:ABC transporter ATP-binding protein [Denitrobaculum tricleocarpae]|uniref:ABC transporter ATP-binding protein n=1 Tax=Denitrobaculum tricleocarpae TaxID=2591009 RepID=A0A545U0S5_9PROT|nr:ABC transporter ATP-binding protein [Denitrobaculum tricleocarpae]TQV83081.1 ABC transporter ATP-binding protein [Denitrobaculum tricleocarpae]